MAQIMDVSPIPCVDVIFLNKDHTKTLLFRRNNKPAQNEYFAMGGRILKNETFKEAAVRKSMQELGFTIDPTKLCGPFVGEEVWDDSVYPGVNYHAIPIYFFYELEESGDLPVHFDSQHSEKRWFDIDSEELHELIHRRLVNIGTAYD